MTDNLYSIGYTDFNIPTLIISASHLISFSAAGCLELND